jgi:hypothetical protein
MQRDHGEGQDFWRPVLRWICGTCFRHVRLWSAAGIVNQLQRAICTGRLAYERARHRDARYVAVDRCRSLHRASADAGRDRPGTRRGDSAFPAGYAGRRIAQQAETGCGRSSIRGSAYRRRRASANPVPVDRVAAVAVDRRVGGHRVCRARPAPAGRRARGDTDPSPGSVARR